MKIKKIAKLCKQSSRISIKIGGGNQFVGDGNALYGVSDLPNLNSSMVMTIFDIPAKDREEYTVEKENVWLADIAREPYENEYEVGVVPDFEISFNGLKIKAASYPKGIVLFESRYFEPFEDLKASPHTLYSIREWHGKPYLVVKSGLFVQAVIPPVEMDSMISNEFEKIMTNIAENAITMTNSDVDYKQVSMDWGKML